MMDARLERQVRKIYTSTLFQYLMAALIVAVDPTPLQPQPPAPPFYLQRGASPEPSPLSCARVENAWLPLLPSAEAVLPQPMRGKMTSPVCLLN
jgi:hypothetical protein